jgi:3-hydroxybutyryl-CoA dehydrogenase
MLRSVSRFGVVGAGQMGTGIAFVAAVHAKLPTVLVDSNHTQIEKSRSFIRNLLGKQVSKGNLSQIDADQAIDRIKLSSELDELHESQFIVEAVSENLEVKSKIFKTIDQIIAKRRDDVILASNTSSISITKLAACTSKPEQFIGMHFMNPVPVMKLVEVIPGLATNQETIDITMNLAKSFGKITTRSEDVPGFIANRLLMPYINEAVFALQEGIGSVEDIDITMKLGTNVPMGPLTLADFIGLDTCLAIMQVLHEGLGDSKYRPSPLLVKYVDAGWLGKKSGRGFYKY